MVVDEKTRMFEPPAPGQGTEKRDRAYLVVLAGSAVGEMYKVDQERTIIGRGGKAQIRLIDDGISREHAEIVVRGREVFLHDLGSTNGTFCNGMKVDNKPLADGDKILVGSTTILKFTYHDNLDEVFQRQMYESALRDGLTKAFNKKYFTDRLESEFMFSVRHSSPLTLVMFDIDHFKKINDSYGHPTGDEVLRRVAAILGASARKIDIVARYGGEEFAIVLESTDRAGARNLAERIRAEIEQQSFPTGQQSKAAFGATISLGVACFPDDATAKADIIARADQSLYAAKHGGRNRTVCYADTVRTGKPLQAVK